MPASKPLTDLRKQAAELITDRLKRVRVAEVADDLRISRQAVYDLKKGKYCPSLSLIQRACEVWEVRFDYKGIRIDNKSFPAKKKRLPEAVQGNLFEALDNRSFEIIATKPMGRAVEVTLRLTMPEKVG